VVAGAAAVEALLAGAVALVEVPVIDGGVSAVVFTVRSSSPLAGVEEAVSTERVFGVFALEPTSVPSFETACGTY
jgi:hypothetical protein